jgi:DNA-binding beta-propeller fold protein YncE
MPGFTATEIAIGLLACLAAFSPSSAHASGADAGPPLCSKKEATELLTQGMQQQSELETEAAMASYARCLKKEPGCVACRYEIGWSFWKLGRWEEVIKTWEDVLKLEPDHALVAQFLPTAKENLALLRQKKIPPAFRSSVELATKSKPEDGPVSMILSARRQSYDPHPENPLDKYDPEIHSPKSVRFSQDGKKVYVNSLEAGRTVVYDAFGFTKTGSIKHKFAEEDSALFDASRIFNYRFPKKVKKPNVFLGKPVELELTHNGKYLWAPYYRRSFDENGTLPSAVAVIDTKTDEIVRVMGTGPISKYVKASPKGNWLAISHWGDNTVGLIDIRGDEPKKFKRAALLVVEKRLPLTGLGGDRDKFCGFCVRGLAFTPDERYLFVSRMKGGGVAIFDLAGFPAKKPKYLGSLFGILPGPRDLEITHDGTELYMSCNASGFVARVPTAAMVEAVSAAVPPERRVEVNRKELGVRVAYVGLGARSIRLSPDERHLFVAVNQTSELVAVDTKSMKAEARIPVDSYPVGLDLSPDGGQLWVTSQGRSAKGGNSVGVFQVRYRNDEVIKR